MTKTKECRGGKRMFVLSSSLRIPDPSLLFRDPRRLINLPRNWLGKGNGNPLQYSCLENPVDGEAWWVAVHGIAQSWTRLKRACTGEGNGNPLQFSCLKNPRDGGAWWAAVFGVSQSWTWVKRLSSNSSSRNWLSQVPLLFTWNYHNAVCQLETPLQNKTFG